MRPAVLTAKTVREIVEVLMRYLETSNILPVSLNHDFYWAINEHAKYDPYHEPTDHLLGQLYDDWDSLARLVKGEEPVLQDLVRLSSVLTYLAESSELQRSMDETGSSDC
jgi:hypothetical protein